MLADKGVWWCAARARLENLLPNSSREPKPPTPSSHSLPRAFVAGATGFTGRALAAQNATAHGVAVTLQVRPGSKHRGRLQGDPRIAEVEISDPIALRAALQEMDAVIQLIGTVQARFCDDGDYEAVDYGTTKALLAAAKCTAVKHFVLLSSVGASTGMGSYLAWKKKTEDLVRESSIPYTIFRPSYLAGDEAFPERASVRNSSAFLAGLSDTPFGGPFALIRPINIQVLARVMLHVVGERGARNEVIGGAKLFGIARAAELNA